MAASLVDAIAFTSGASVGAGRGNVFLHIFSECSDSLLPRVAVTVKQ